MRGRAGDGGTWLIAGMAALALATLVGVLGFLLHAGLAPFWPAPVEEIRLRNGEVILGEVVAADRDAVILRTSETIRPGDAYRRIANTDIDTRLQPTVAVRLELDDGRRLYQLEPMQAGEARQAGSAVRERLQPNALGLPGRIAAFARSVGHFLGSAPDASNLAGGVLPALIGTVLLVLLMSVAAMPLGIATAAFLHERRGLGVRLVRGAINQLAGMPAIVYGVLGLGLFVHGIGAGIDRWFYADRLPLPTFGSGGLLWAALTLALLTLPVVVVSVEEGLARLPRALREGALALGATRDEALWTLLLPAVRPALLTGLVLAIARAAGSVAPLMLVGVVKLAPELPLDGRFPYLHPSQQFMHLGVTIYDAALASPDALRGVPRAYACAALLVAVVVLLNLSAILLRNRLRERYRALEN